MFDLGSQRSQLYSARLFLMPPSSPSPPAPPPPDSPPNTPTNTGRRQLFEIDVSSRWKDLDSPMQHRQLQDEVPTGAAGEGIAVVCDVQLESAFGYASTTKLSDRIIAEPDALRCEHDCVRNPICNYWTWAQNSDLDGLCTLFNQVTSYAASASSNTVSGRCDPERNPSAFHMPGTLELWVSRSLALFGTRAAVIDTTKMVDGQITTFLTEGDDMAEGRYVYLRSFDSNRELRIDGLQFFAVTLIGRRLDDEHKDEPKTKPKNEDEYFNTLKDFSWTRIYAMRNLTLVTCNNETNAPLVAKEARQNAAMLWAELTEDESSIGCISCLTRRPSNCTQWFVNMHGVRRGHTDVLEKKRRQMKEQLDKDEPERIRKLEDALGSTCCKTNRKTGEKTCGREHCAEAFKTKAQQRMAHVLRELHDRPGKTTLTVPQLVATDMVSPFLHHKSECQSEAARDSHGHIECVASSLLKHLGTKHGFSEEDINSKLQTYGVSVAKILTAQLYHQAEKTSQKKTEFHSDTHANEKASNARRAAIARRKLGLENDAPIRRASPRASWLKKSTSYGRRMNEREKEGREEEEGGGGLIGVAALAVSGKELRLRRKLSAEFSRNQSLAAKSILKTANLAVATNKGTPATMSNLMSAAFDASVASDASLLGRARIVANGAGRIGSSVSKIHQLVHDAVYTKHKNMASSSSYSSSSSSSKRLSKRRALSAKEEAYFQRVEKMTGANGPQRGFNVREDIEENYGWITEALDWPYWWEEAHRVGRVLYNRHESVHQHAEDTGTLPVGELEEHHKTGYAILDINAPPTEFGTWVRAKFEGGQRHAPHRKLAAKRSLLELPRSEPIDKTEVKSVVGAFLDAAVNDRDPVDAAWYALHYNNHHRQSARKLVELTSWVSQNTVDNALSYGEKLAPKIFGPGTSQVPSEVSVEGESGLDPLRQAARYVVYDTLLCYLYPPPSFNGGAMGDGTNFKLHYSERACFPMIPYIPADMKTFNDEFGLGDQFSWSDLEFDNACNSDAVKALLGPMSADLTSISILAAPYGSLLRFAEGIDSIRNLARTSDDSLTESQKAAAVVCAIAQLGGIIWVAASLIFLALFFICAPIGAWSCLKCYRICRGAQRRNKRREEAIDALIASQNDSVDMHYATHAVVGTRTVRAASGHVLLGTGSDV